MADTNNNRIERFNPLNPAATGCEAASASPPPLDVAPTVQVSLPRSAGHPRAPRARPDRQLQARLQDPRDRHALAGKRGAAKLVALARSLPAALPGHVRLRVRAATLVRLRAELGRHTLMTARVHIVAVGPTGRRTIVTHTYVVSR